MLILMNRLKGHYLIGKFQFVWIEGQLILKIWFGMTTQPLTTASLFSNHLLFSLFKRRIYFPLMLLDILLADCHKIANRLILHSNKITKQSFSLFEYFFLFFNKIIQFSLL